MLIDTHSHLSFKAYDADREEVVKRTREAGMICIDVGTKYETSKRAVELAEKNENIYASIGLYPSHASSEFQKIKTDSEEGELLSSETNFDKEKYKELAKSKKVVAIGEVGLDYYYKPKTNLKFEQLKQKQKEVFIQQLELAEELNLPMILHCRMAHNDVLEILSKSKNVGVVHCFTGNWEEAQKYLDLGFYLGINGIIFKFDIDEVIKKAPLDKLLLETDCPYLTPLPAVALAKEGPEGYVRNEPTFVKHVAQRIAELRGISFDEVASATTTNAKKLFKI